MIRLAIGDLYKPNSYSLINKNYNALIYNKLKKNKKNTVLYTKRNLLIINP
jgi:hypothetical protein